MKWIIVGAGSAGCVVTRRLVDAGHDVTLLECGPTLERGAVPPAIDAADALAALDEPGRIHSGLLARRSRGTEPSPYLRGRGVGGSSAVNGMVARWGNDERLRVAIGLDVDEHRSRVLLPLELPDATELGRLDRTLLQASPDATIAPLNRRAGRRVTSAEAYLWPVAHRFELRSETLVDRIALDGSGAPAGAILADGVRLDADRVALCAGAVHTPAILLRSGIFEGVGVGLADHPAAGLVVKFRDTAGASGLVTASTIEQGEVQTTPLNHLGSGAPPDLAMLSTALLRPSTSSGTVRLRSDDPHVHPHVDLDLLADPSDVESLADAVETTVGLATGGAVADVVSDVFVDDVGTTLDVLADRPAMRRWLRTSASGYVHAACSCSAALDHAGHVRGHDGLVVADASAFVEIPDANLHMPVTLLAECFAAAWIDQG